MYDIYIPLTQFPVLIAVIVDCGPLKNPDNGLVTFTYTTVGSTALYSCSLGYNLVGDSVRTCLASGEWSSVAPQCRGVSKCKPLSDIQNGHVLTTSNAIGSVATYSCKKGYRLIGEHKRVCLSTAVWSSSEPSCKGERWYVASNADRCRSQWNRKFPKMKIVTP